MSTLKINKYWCINIIIAIVSIIISSFFTIEQLSLNMEKNLFILGWAINLLFVWSVYSIYKMKKNILDFNIIFLGFIFLFCNGQVFLYTIGVKIEQLSVLKMITNYEIIKEVIYFYFSLLFFQIGSMLCINSRKDTIFTKDNEKYNNAIRIVACLMFALSVFPYFYILIPKVVTSITRGYSSLYTDANNVSGLIGYASKFFVPSVIMLLFTYRNNKKILNFGLISLLTIAMMSLIIGTRGDALSIVVILIVFYNTFVKKFEGAKLLKLLAIILAIMLIIPVIASFRSMSNKSIDGLINEFGNNLTGSDSNFMIDTISELGYTMHSFILTDQVIPSIENYKYGESYFASVMMLIPSSVMGGYSFASKAALDIWLQDIHNMSYGPGFSIIAETYYNFGFYGGIIFTIVIGFIFTKMLNVNSNDGNKYILLRLLSLVFLYNSLIIARFPFHNTVRNIVYMYIVPYFAIIIIHNTINKKGSVCK